MNAPLTLITGTIHLPTGLGGAMELVQDGSITFTPINRTRPEEVVSTTVQIESGTFEATALTPGDWEAFIRSTNRGAFERLRFSAVGVPLDLHALLMSERGAPTTESVPQVLWRLPWTSFNTGTNGGWLTRVGPVVTLRAASPWAYNGAELFTPPAGFRLAYASQQPGFLYSSAATSNRSPFNDCVTYWGGRLFTAVPSNLRVMQDGSEQTQQLRYLHATWVTTDESPEEISKDPGTDGPYQLSP